MTAVREEEKIKLENYLTKFQDDQILRESKSSYEHGSHDLLLTNSGMSMKLFNFYKNKNLTIKNTWPIFKMIKFEGKVLTVAHTDLAKNMIFEKKPIMVLYTYFQKNGIINNVYIYFCFAKISWEEKNSF